MLKFEFTANNIQAEYETLITDRKILLDCKVIMGEILTSQHKVLVMDVIIKAITKRKSHMVVPQIKWWNLNGEKQGLFERKILEGGFGQTQRTSNDIC